MEEYVAGSPTAGHNTDTWQTDVDLTSLIPILDTAASDLVSHQRDSLVQ